MTAMVQLNNTMGDALLETLTSNKSLEAAIQQASFMSRCQRSLLARSATISTILKKFETWFSHQYFEGIHQDERIKVETAIPVAILRSALFDMKKTTKGMKPERPSPR